ncbi:MAG: hypothetical protein LBG24_12365 [Treponema sp.]|jgi:hypothetical protein|nr:hypothetical protein [Treponema sp.]
MSLKDVPGLKEPAYCACLEKVSHWDLFQGKLSLYTRYPEGRQESLLFSAD